MSNSCDPLDCNPPGSSVQGISQARVLEWVAISFSRGVSQPRDWTQFNFYWIYLIPNWICIVGRFFTDWATREPHFIYMCAYAYIYICAFHIYMHKCVYTCLNSSLLSLWNMLLILSKKAVNFFNIYLGRHLR